MTTPSETLEATRLQREEARAKMSSRPWERRWARRRKGKDGKGKGKTKGDQNQGKDDKDSAKK
jgi:hypothetical protein